MASDDGYKDGWFTFKEIHKYLVQGVYPSSFSKSDKQALRKRAKFFAARSYTTRVEVRIKTTFCNCKYVTSQFLFPRAYNARRRWMSGYYSASCVESVDKELSP